MSNRGMAMCLERRREENKVYFFQGGSQGPTLLPFPHIFFPLGDPVSENCGHQAIQSLLTGPVEKYREGLSLWPSVGYIKC